MKKAIVIGATSGIGKEIAKQLANDNFRVGITGRRKDLLEETRKSKPEFYIAKTFDIRELETIEKNLEELVENLGGLDLLVISSGTGKVKVELDFEDEKNTILTNTLGFTCIADWAINYFEKQNSLKQFSLNYTTTL